MTVFDQITEQDIVAAIDKVEFNLTSIDKDEFTRRMVGLVRGELLPKDVQGIDDEQMEQIYALAYNALQAGRTDEAEKLFQFLCENDFTVSRYWLGLGACRFMMERPGSAAQAYSMAAVAAPEDPRPVLRAADCWLAMGEVTVTLALLEQGIALCVGDEHDERHAQATALKSLLLSRKEEG